MSKKQRPQVVIAGAGHGSLIALLELSKRPPQADIVLVSRLDHAHYSGMVPGWIEGIYTEAAMSVPLGPFARKAGVTLLQGDVAGADDGHLHLADGRAVPFDILVVNTGSETALPGPLDSPHVVPAKPFERLIPGVRPHLADGPSFVVVGGGVAGVEIAFSLRARRPEAAVSVVERDETLLPALPRAFAERVLRDAERDRIDLRLGCTVDAVGPRQVQLADGTSLPAACTIALTGARPPDWLDATPFTRADDGFLAVDERLQVVSHPHVLAVGDTATRVDDPRPKAGVFSVRSGPPLADAVRALVAGVAPRPVHLQRRALFLMSTGHRSAIGTRNGIVVEGRWVWRLKDHLDRSFISRLKGGPGR